MKGVPARSRPPPFGFDVEPEVGWKARKKFGDYAELPALRFLSRARAAVEVERLPSGEKPRQRPPAPRRAPFQKRANSAAIKQKHFRERVKAGKCVLKVECEQGALEALLEASGLLPPATDAARTEVEAAVGKLLALLIRDHAVASSD
jgi:hypothetical protein